MHETFIEVIELAAMRLDPDQVRMRVYNTNPIIKSELDKLDPLVLINGILIQDLKMVAELNPARIAYIDVVAQQYRLGPKIFGGIIALTTKENDFKLPQNTPNTINFELLRPIQNADFQYKNYGNQPESTRIPDYRAQLYWDPEITITQQPKEIVFYTSDKTGTFEIKLTGYNVSGEKIEFLKTFTVIPSQ
ncbi:MAG: hypothetical protein WA951_11310 [Leeuwenhoekiella sp.]